MENPKKPCLKKLFSLPKAYEDWNLGDKYIIESQIGIGSYGCVVKAKNSKTNQIVAIKRIPKLFDDLVDCKRILREIIFLRKFQHENLIKIIEIL